MPRITQESFLQHKFPDPAVEFDESFPVDRSHRELRRVLEAAFRRASIDIFDFEITVRDFFSIFAAFAAFVRETKDITGWPEPCSTFFNEAAAQIAEWYEEHIADAFNALHQAVIVPLVAHSRFDQHVVAVTFRQDTTENGKFAVRLRVSCTKPQSRRVSLDGESRPMYRVGTANEWQGVQWLSWNAEQLSQFESKVGLADRPIYVQSHALRQLRDRVNLPSISPYVEYWLHDSLKSPVIVDRQGDDLLVEYRVMDSRLGYLVVTPQPDLIAVRTFKFLTMERTPEARLLREQLRLSRRDIDWLGLHEMSAFTQTDLRDDPVLRPIFEACGCGQLFELAEAGFDASAPASKPFAAEVRKYLRLAA